ncbi:MAG TPA: PKD domain-containing protein [Thermoplasmatales archaeon]|nr:PKD domain-containing protein [Thermoplasmatales archaeon]
MNKKNVSVPLIILIIVVFSYAGIKKSYENEIGIFSISLNSSNPVASFNFQINGYSVMLDASSSYDDGEILNYTWDMGDGSIAYGKIVYYKYSAEGAYMVCLTVKDNDNNENSTCKKIFIDLTPPFTTHRIIPSSPNGKKGWYTSKVKIELIPSDNLSGINATFYKINGKRWKIYENFIEISEDGYHEISYYSVDNNGNEENEKRFEIRIDATEPYTICTFSRNESNGWFTKPVSISLNAIDNFSGVEETYCSVDSESLEKYEEIINLGEGIHMICYFSIDRAGNAEGITKREVKVDKNPPEIKLKSPLNGIYVFNKKIFNLNSTVVIGNITIYAETNDYLSGVKKIELYLNGEYKANSTSSELKYEIDERYFGIYRVKVVAEDFASNYASIEKNIFMLNLK